MQFPQVRNSLDSGCSGCGHAAWKVNKVIKTEDIYFPIVFKTCIASYTFAVTVCQKAELFKHIHNAMKVNTVRCRLDKRIKLNKSQVN